MVKVLITDKTMKNGGRLQERGVFMLVMLNMMNGLKHMVLLLE